MKMRRAMWIAFTACWCVALGATGLHAEDSFTLGREKRTDAESTLVVFNRNDPDSRTLANYYAEKRGIPADRVVWLSCATTEEISRAEYDATIAEPLRKLMVARGWWKLGVSAEARSIVKESAIRFVVLMRGVPLKIARLAEPYPGDEPNGPQSVAAVNEASVDSELSLLGSFTRSISGALNNPYFRSFRTFGDAAHPEQMLVCRLDGPSPAIVRGMIDDSVETERKGLWGMCYLDIRSIKDPGMASGDDWILKAGLDAQHNGFLVILDNSEAMFPSAYPMGHAALYYGWYSENVGGPIAGTDFRFVPGAVACHIHSFSAATVRDSTRNWVGPFVAHGAAATMGNVYEPFLGLTPQLDVFQDRLRRGFTFAESAYMSQNVLSWMTTFVGDPLYRPFRVINDFLETPAQSEWTDYRNGAITWFEKGRAAGEEQLVTSGNARKSGLIFEGLGLLQAGKKDIDAALASLQRAGSLYKSPEDVLRVQLHAVNLLRFNGRPKEALSLTKKVIKSYPTAIAVEVFRGIEAELAPPPPPPPASPPR